MLSTCLCTNHTVTDFFYHGQEKFIQAQKIKSKQIEVKGTHVCHTLAKEKIETCHWWYIK